MKMENLQLILYLVQTNFADNDKTVPAGTAFDPIAPLFFDLAYAIGTILGLVSAYRIYVNHNLGEESLLKGTTNWLLGLISLVVVVVFCKALL